MQSEEVASLLRSNEELARRVKELEAGVGKEDSTSCGPSLEQQVHSLERENRALMMSKSQRRGSIDGVS